MSKRQREVITQAERCNLISFISVALVATFDTQTPEGLFLWSSAGVYIDEEATVKVMPGSDGGNMTEMQAYAIAGYCKINFIECSIS